MRRVGLALILGLVFILALAACGGEEEETAMEEPKAPEAMPTAMAVVQPTAAAPLVGGGMMGETKKAEEAAPETMAMAKFQEAPMLAELVVAGKLPPVEERLPKDPMVIPVHERVGTYGGEIRRVYKGSNLSCNFGRPIREGLVRPSVDGSSIVLAVAASIEPDETGKVWTVKIRDGMKWSDGMPFTSEDFLFQYERVSNADLEATKPLWVSLDGETLADVKALDDITIQFTYGTPNFIFMDTQLVMDADCGRPGNGGRRIPYSPKHYLKQFFPAYAEGGEAALEKMAKAEGFDTWPQLYLSKNTDVESPDKPTMRMVVLDSGITGKRIIGDRNPYFYAVDPEGNQLPYIDRWIWDKVEDKAALNLKAIGGEIDFQSRHIDLSDYTILKENEQGGGFRVFLWPSMEENDAALAMNISHQGPQGEWFRNEEFRHALSYAIDRAKVNEIAFLGTGVARNLMPPKGHPYFPGEDLEFKYMEHEPAKSIEILDRIMPDKDEDGFRLMDNGEPIVVDIWSTESFAPFPDIAELIINDWAKVGIKGENKADLGQQMGETFRSNEHGAHLYHHIASGLIFSYPDKLIPIYRTSAQYAIGYGTYVETGGEEGVKPIPEIQEIIDWFYEGPNLPDEPRFEKGRQIYARLADKQYHINVIANSPATQGVLIVKDQLINVPEKAANSWPARTPSTGYPEQFFWDR
jgi:peptide/nickel transport system substrate-binding protein